MSPMVRIARLAHARELLEQSASAADAGYALELRSSARKILREVFANSAPSEFAHDEKQPEANSVESYRSAML